MSRRSKTTLVVVLVGLAASLGWLLAERAELAASGFATSLATEHPGENAVPDAPTSAAKRAIGANTTEVPSAAIPGSNAQPPDAPEAFAVRRRRLVVHIVDQSGAPVADGAIQLWEVPASGGGAVAPRRVGSIAADPTGRVDTWCAAGRELVVLTTSRLAPLPEWASSRIVRPGASDVELRVQHDALRSISGTVVESGGGTPLAGVRVEYWPDSPPHRDSIASAVRVANEEQPHAVSQPNGAFRIRGVNPPGTLIAKATGYSPLTHAFGPQPINPASVLRLERKAGWMGRVRAANGGTPPAASVWLLGPGDAHSGASDAAREGRRYYGFPMKADAGGRYFIDLSKRVLSRRGLGRYQLVAAAPGYSQTRSKWIEFDSEAAISGTFPDLTLTRGTGTLRVVVELPKERVAGPGYLIVAREDLTRALPVALHHCPELRDGDEIELPHLPDEPLVVGFREIGSKSLRSQVAFSVPPRTTAEVRLRLAR